MTSLGIATAQSLITSDVSANGRLVARASTDGAAMLIRGKIDRAEARYRAAIAKARPWRRDARAGDIHRARRIDDERSSDRATP